MLLAVINPESSPSATRRSRRGCTVGCLATLLILALIIGGGWFFVLRPYIHNIAQTELDKAMTTAVNQIPSQASELPPGSMLPVQENAINNLIVIHLAPSNPVQHPVTKITKQGIRLQFDLYGYACAVTTVPQVANGHLVVRNVQVEGILSLIMTPQEMETLLNKHLADAEGRLQHTVTKVQLNDHEMDLTVG